MYLTCYRFVWGKISFVTRSKVHNIHVHSFTLHFKKGRGDGPSQLYICADQEEMEWPLLTENCGPDSTVNSRLIAEKAARLSLVCTSGDECSHKASSNIFSCFLSFLKRTSYTSRSHSCFLCNV